MRDLAILAIQLIATIAKLLLPGGVRSVLSESLLLEHQLLILNRSRARAPNLRPIDRIIASLCAGLMRPARLLRSAALLALQARRMEAEIIAPVEWSELFIGAQSANPHDGLSDLLRTKLAALWPNEIGNRKGFPEILLKYERALDCAESLSSPLTRPAVDGALLLIETRNALTHAKENFRPAAPQGPATLWSPLEQKLRARVEPSALTPTSAMCLWCRVLAAPLAEWAFVTAHEYASAAYAALGGATNIFANERSRLRQSAPS